MEIRRKNTIFTAVDSFKSILEIVRYRISMIFAFRAIWFRILVIPNPVLATCCPKANDQETRVGTRKVHLLKSQQPGMAD